MKPINLDMDINKLDNDQDSERKKECHDSTIVHDSTFVTSIFIEQDLERTEK